MQYSDFRFNPARDKVAVSVTGGPDLRSALANGVVPTGVIETEADYNGIDVPESILGKPRDVFEAMDMQGYVSRGLSQSPDDKPENE